MRNRILAYLQMLVIFARNIRQRIDAFWRKEDELYWADPAAYRRRTDLFWTKVQLVYFISFFLIVWLGA